MALFDLFKKNTIKNDAPKAYYKNFGGFLGDTFDGEKDFAVMGAPKNVYVDYYAAANRAMNLYITNDLARSGIQRFVQFAVGRGLEIHAQPDAEFLKRKYNIDLDKDFNTDIESLWVLWSQDKSVSSDKLSNFHQLAYTLLINVLVAGDMLVIKRVKNSNLEFQLVDGRNVYSNKIKNPDNDNRIINGVEINASGEHIAYYVIEDDLKEKRIETKDSKGRLNAWLVYADKHRVGTTRGLSRIICVAQRMDQLSEYSESEVIASVTNSRFTASIEHDDTSSGVNPMKTLGVSIKKGDGNSDSDSTSNALKAAANQIRKMTKGIILNLGKGQKLKDFDTKRPSVNYTNFIDTNAKYVYPVMDMSAEVVTMQFGQSYSASRAALKMFEEILKVSRQHTIIDGLYYPGYKLWFELEVLKGNINAPKFFDVQSDGYFLNAYYDCRFVGTPIPHIDPVKEVAATQAKLNSGLITYTQAMEDLGNISDFAEVVRKRAEEEKTFKDNGIIPNNSILLEEVIKEKKDA